LLFIIVFASAATARGMLTVLCTPPTPITEPTQFPQENSLPMNPNMTFNLFPENVSLEVGDLFVITVAVTNSTDMYGWQVYLRFDPTILECIGTSLPSNQVFSSKATVCGTLAEYNRTEFPQGHPLTCIRNDEGWVMAGDCLIGAKQQEFNGSGVLCQIEFKAISSGATCLALFHDGQTFTFGLYFSAYAYSDLKWVTTTSASYSYVYVASN
jgi:hypothetical protein